MTINDTHAEAQRFLTAQLREVPVWRKLEMLAELNRTANQLAMNGLREMYPNASESEIRRHLANLLLGPDLAKKAFGPQPSKNQTIEV